jgi:hypothetical protein
MGFIPDRTEQAIAASMLLVLSIYVLSFSKT